MYTALKKAQILLPRSDIDLEKWAVIACDQFTGQPEYWRQAEQIVGDAPSTLRLTLPEAYLSESGNRVPAIQQTMRDYLAQGVLEQAVDGFVLVERTTPSGIRPGLVAALELTGKTGLEKLNSRPGICFYTAGSGSPGEKLYRREKPNALFPFFSHDELNIWLKNS